MCRSVVACSGGLDKEEDVWTGHKKGAVLAVEHEKVVLAVERRYCCCYSQEIPDSLEDCA
jgi:hypothetical protein